MGPGEELGRTASGELTLPLLSRPGPQKRSRWIDCWPWHVWKDSCVLRASEAAPWLVRAVGEAEVGSFTLDLERRMFTSGFPRAPPGGGELLAPRAPRDPSGTTDD